MSSIKNFIHIGFSKTGSSFLKYWFDAHPELHYSNKEALGGFKDTSSIYDYTKTNDIENLKYFVTSDTRMHCWRILDVDSADNWFDIKDTYNHQEKVSKITRSLFGEAKILIITRGFEGVLQSFYSSYIKRGGTNNLEGMLNKYQKDYILPAYNYDFIINLYMKNFGKENVLVLPYEILKDNLESFLNEIEFFLGLTHNNFTPAPVNVSFEPNEMYWYRKMSSFLKTLINPLSEKHSTKIYRKYVHLLSENKLHFVVALLNMFSSKKEPLKIPDTYLKEYKGKASVLKENPFYKKYYKYYFID